MTDNTGKVKACPEYDEALTMAAWAGELPESLAVHLGECRGCRLAHGSLREKAELAGEALRVKVPRGLGGQVAAGVFKATTRRVEENTRRRAIWTLAGGGAAAAAVAAGLIAYTASVRPPVIEEEIDFRTVNFELLEYMDVAEELEMLELLEVLEKMDDA